MVSLLFQIFHILGSIQHYFGHSVCKVICYLYYYQNLTICATFVTRFTSPGLVVTFALLRSSRRSRSMLFIALASMFSLSFWKKKCCTVIDLPEQ